MRYLICALLVTTCLGQTTKPATLAQRYVESQTKISELEIDNHSLEAQLKDRDDKIVSLTTKNQDLDSQLQKFIQLQKDTMAFNQQVIDAYGKLGDEHAQVVDKFNQLLTYARGLASDNAQIVRNVQYNQRVANALAFYSLLPKPQQYPVPAVQPQAGGSNCVSRTIGTTVFTDCN